MKTFKFKKQLNPHSLRKILILLLVLIIIIPTLLYFYSNRTKPVSASWWDEDWQYRKAIPVTNNTTAETNVYIVISNYDASDTTKYQADCGDIRFTKENGEPLPYYLTNCGATATIHVNFNTFPDGNQTIFIYYGNSNVENGSEEVDFSTAASNYTVGSIASEEVTPGPIAYWKFDEGYGTNTKDSTSNSNTATFSGSTVSWKSAEDCLDGKCVYFDGNSGYLDAGNGNALNQTTGVTVSMWVKNQRATGKHTFLLRKASGTGGYGIYQNTSEQINFFVYWASGSPQYQFCSATNYTLPQNEWTHIAGEFKQNDYLKVYINGQEKGSCTPLYSTAINTSGNNLLMGYQGWWGSDNAYFKGFMDDVKIYPYARTANAIKTDYLRGSGSSGSNSVLGAVDTSYLNNGLVGYWKMDEASWNGTPGEVIDSSKNGANGTSVNSANTTSAKYAQGGSFDGISKYVSFTAISPTVNTFSIATWVYITGDGAGGINGLISADKFRLFVNNSNNYLRSQIGSSGSYDQTSSVAVSRDTWHHVMLTFDGNNRRYYLDGELKETNSTYGTGAGWSSNLGTIQTNTYNLNGYLDETRVYNRALSSFEVNKLYNFAPGPSAYWNMDEGTGQYIYDTSGNGNTGTLGSSGGSDSADPSWIPGKYDHGLDFTDDTNYLTVTSTALTNQFTISFWSNNRGSDTWDGIIGGPTASQGYISNGNTTITYRDNSSQTCSATVSTNTWVHAVFVHANDNSNSWYINGVKTSCSSFSSAFTFNQIGRFWNDTTSYGFDGSLDDIRVYNYARTQEQIIQDMQNSDSITDANGKNALLSLNLNEGYDTVAHDAGYNKDDGALVDGPTWTNDGKFGKALNLDGLNDRIQTFTSNPFEYTGADLTLSAWIYQDDTDSDVSYIFSKPWNGSGQYNYRLRIDAADTLSLFLFGSTAWSVTSTQTIPANTWTHVAATIEKGTNAVKLYINGISIASGTHDISSWTPGSGDSDISLCIGSLYPYNAGWAGDTTFSFDGKIDEIKIYTSSLTDNQIAAEYNHGSGEIFGASSTDASGNPDNSATREYCVPGDTTSCAAPVGEWKMDEGLETASSYDTSGNGYTATLYNSPTWVNGKMGKGLQFNGTNQYTSATMFNYAIDTANNDYTISGWVKLTAYDDSGYFVYTPTVSGASYLGPSMYTDATESLFFYCGNTVSRASSSVLNVNTWYHFTGICNRNKTLNLYINGVRATDGSFTNHVNSTASYIRFGGNDNASRYASVAMDNIRFYNYARTPAQIAWEYNRGEAVAKYEVNECSGNTLHDTAEKADRSTSGYDGTIYPGDNTGNNDSVGTCNSGAADPTNEMWNEGSTGKFNASLSFDGTNDYVDLGDPSSGVFDFGTSTNFTLSAWIKTTNSSIQSITEKNNTQRWLIRMEASGIIRSYANDGTNEAYSDSIKTVNDGNWHHIVGIFNRTGNITTYIDGQASGTPASMSSVGNIDITGNLYIGSQNGTSRFFSGQIDEVQVFNYALTEAQVKLLYNQNSAIKFE